MLHIDVYIFIQINEKESISIILHSLAFLVVNFPEP